MGNTILLVEDPPDVRSALEQALEGEENVALITAADSRTALQTLGTRPVDMVIAGARVGDEDGAALLGTVKQLFPDVPRLLVAREGDPSGPAPGAGAADGVTTIAAAPTGEALREAVRARLAMGRLSREEAALVQYAGLAPERLERARRIRGRMQSPRPLGEILVELGELSREAYELAVRHLRSTMGVAELLRADGRLTDENLAVYEELRRREPKASDRQLLLGANLVTEEHFLRALCDRLQLEYRAPEIGLVDGNLLSKSSFKYLIRHNVLPVRIADGRLSVIVADPEDGALLAELQRLFRTPLVCQCCTAAKIGEALRTLERLGGDAPAEGGVALQYRELEKIPDKNETGEEAVQIVDYLLGRAIQIGASDLHIESLQNKMRVRVRIDGVLQHLTDLPADFAPRVVSRVKILARADIAERRLHQDGKICVKLEGREIDIRVSTYASVHGETVVMRLLDRDRGLVPVADIGFTARAFDSLTEVVLKASSGLVLVVGPTGSGKTTTLYSFIDYANDPSEKVITCEDPVEYVMNGVVQCSVNEKTGPTFADSLRAIVRQDPDTIVVGEIRDRTTAALALEAALTGHKVFSTFHTEDAVGAFLRLLEMGVEPFLVASTISAVIAQRLIRRLCPHCRKPSPPSRAAMRFLNLERTELRAAQFFAPGLCAQCNGTGFKGRMAIHEVLLANDDFRDAVLRRASSKELRDHARRLPEFLTMQEDGVLKAADGSTSLDEVIANAPRDLAPRPLSAIRSIGRLSNSR